MNRVNKAGLILLATVSSLFLSGCIIHVEIPYNNFGRAAINGSGNVVSQMRSVENISRVSLENEGDLIIKIGDTESLLIEADDNYLQYIKTEVSNGELSIDTSGNKFLRDYESIKYYLTVKNLDSISIRSIGSVEAPDLQAKDFSISISSTGKLEMTDLQADSLKVRITSTGSVRINELQAASIEVKISSTGNLDIRAGAVQRQDIHLSSTGSYWAQDLSSNTVDVVLNSTGSAIIAASDHIRARLNSVGNVRYTGNPELDVRTSSVGRVIPLR